VSDSAVSRRPPRTSRWKAVAAAASAALAVAVLGGISTDIGPWYRSLVEPPWKPPDALFGPAWAVISLRGILQILENSGA